VKTIYVIGTDSCGGKGGISISTRNLIKGFLDYQVVVKEVVSHSSSSRVKSFVSAFVFLSQVRCEGNLFWFQLGPWLSLTRKLILILLVKARGGDILVQVHSQSFEKYTKSQFLKPIYKLIFSFSDYIAFLGCWWSQFADKNYNIPMNKKLIIPNFINKVTTTDDMVSEKELSTVNLLSMSRLVEGKGFESVIELLPHLTSNFHLHIAGDGPLKGALKKLVNDYSLEERVTFHGWVNDNDKFELLKKSHLFILPSSNDSFGMVFIEAMQCSLPVVALRFKGVCDVVPHLKGGYLCENSSPLELKKGIHTLLGDYQEHSLNCKAYVENNYTAEVVIPQLIKSLKLGD